MYVYRGSTGPLVAAVQVALKNWVDPGGQRPFSASIDADGNFGPLTEEAVKQVQYIGKAKVDGVVGPVTAKLLGLDPVAYQSSSGTTPSTVPAKDIPIITDTYVPPAQSSNKNLWIGGALAVLGLLVAKQQDWI